MIDIIFNNIFPFLIILTILVFVHELGHYLVAIYNGVKVETFSIGFGKELFGFTDKSGTRWKFSLIPLGGYVKMHGDLDESSSKVDDSDKINKEKSFHNKTISQRSMILFAGPAANFIFSFVLLVFMNVFYGISKDKPIISEVVERTSAYDVGLQSGDIIIEIDDNKIKRFSELKQYIEVKDNQSVKILYSRDGKVQSINVDVIDKKIGVKGEITFEKLNFFNSCIHSVSQLFEFTKMTIVGIYEIITGTRNTDELGGPIRIAELSGDFWSKGLQSTLWFMMVISLNLGLINLFPIPMLDGGHLVLNFFEFVNRGPLKKEFLEIAHTFGFVLLISLMVFATYNDIARFFE
ncbi:MAG: RIP metalloprotease RseP [Alphaproteobacteria bacterium]|tara:strand:+ start:589 stop:1638 length:1050 start_codon:yes stop_codon:yes gene_type:complete